LIGNGKTVTVVEADEFDRSSFAFASNIACITSMDADHLDIYGTSDAIEESFVEFANKIADKSRLFITTELPLEGSSRMMMIYKAFNVRIADGSYLFDIAKQNGILKDLVLVYQDDII
jgi:UDP-N-acetylmuramate--alanine ligase